MDRTAATVNGEAGTRRAGLLRLAGRAASALASRGAGPARVSVVAVSGGPLRARSRALPSGALSWELRAGPALLDARAGAGLDAAVAAALAAALPGPAYPAAPRRAPAKVLLFRSLLECPGKEGADRLNQGTLYLASALRAAGVPVVLSGAKAGRFRSDPAARAELAALLARHPDVGLAAVSLYDAYFEDARALIAFLRGSLRGRVAVGALMPTRDPAAALAHLPDADFAGRGAGEQLLPRLAQAAGLSPNGPLGEAARGALLELDGTLAADGVSAVWAGAERVPRVADLDRSALDFSFLERRDAESGPTFCLSRGCRSACYFCTSPDQGRFAGKSPEEVGRVLAAYGRRLRELYGTWSRAPAAAFGAGFYDDDFLADADRARGVLAVVRASPFHVRFFQTGVRAFYPAGAPEDGPPARSVLDLLEPGLFAPKIRREEKSAAPQVYIGTESFCDAELTRLGKGYRAAQAEAVARALSSRGLRQGHHLIATNARTRPADVLEGLAAIARLAAECGPAFAILEPVISHLVSFPGTPSRRSLERDGLLARARGRGVLRVGGFPELDYPLADRDEPLDPDVARWAQSLAERGAVGDWAAERARLIAAWSEPGAGPEARAAAARAGGGA